MSDRRDFLKKSTLLGLGSIAGGLFSTEKLQAMENGTVFLSGEEKIRLPDLPYAYDALEPFIDKQTMEIHHKKHHQAYIDKLNSAPVGEVDFSISDEAKCRKVDHNTSPLVRNNLGGYYNHLLFWQMMKPNKDKKEPQPTGKLAEAINKHFKSYEDFKKEFSAHATKVFGSGWCWLVSNAQRGLKIITTPNQDNPLMQIVQEGGKPVLGLDVWEHAYYLKYQNKRADYISNWWNVVNWEKAGEFYTSK